MSIDKLKELKERFDREVNSSHIKFGWDAGHCYTYIDHPIMSEYYEYGLTDDEEDEFYCYTNEALSEMECHELMCDPNYDCCGREFSIEDKIYFLKIYYESDIDSLIKGEKPVYEWHQSTLDEVERHERRKEIDETVDQELVG